MISKFHPLTVAEWDRLTSMIERAGMAAAEAIPDTMTHSYHACQAYAGVADEMTEIHGALVTTWQAEYAAVALDAISRAGSDPDGTEPGAFPVMGADWPAGMTVSGPGSHLHPRCTCTHPATAPCDLSCPVHRGAGSAR
jgi:hypothetical protein